jgi:hypothetical protein
VCRIIADQTGFASSHQPAVPRTSMLQVVAFSATLTACFVDTLTDVSSLQIIFRQVMLLCHSPPALTVGFRMVGSSSLTAAISLAASLQCAALSGDDTWLIPMQKQNNCWWFGKTGKCHNFYILMAFVGVCTVTDIACLFLLGFSPDDEAGTTVSNSGQQWMKRCAVAACCLPFKMEHARLALPSVHLFFSSV